MMGERKNDPSKPARAIFGANFTPEQLAAEKARQGAAIGERWLYLFEKHQIEWNPPECWWRLADALARNHEPNMQVETRGLSMEWPLDRLCRLREAVQAVMGSSQVSAEDACHEIAGADPEGCEEFWGYEGGTLYKKYRSIERPVEGRDPEKDLVLKEFRQSRTNLAKPKTYEATNAAVEKAIQARRRK